MCCRPRSSADSCALSALFSRLTDACLVSPSASVSNVHSDTPRDWQGVQTGRAPSHLTCRWRHGSQDTRICWRLRFLVSGTLFMSVLRSSGERPLRSMPVDTWAQTVELKRRNNVVYAVQEAVLPGLFRVPCPTPSALGGGSEQLLDWRIA